VSTRTPLLRDPVIHARILVVMVNLLWIPMGIFIASSHHLFEVSRIKPEEQIFIASVTVVHFLPSYLVFKRRRPVLEFLMFLFNLETVGWVIATGISDDFLELTCKAVFTLLCAGTVVSLVRGAKTLPYVNKTEEAPIIKWL
jgi:hypothetical protein